MKYNTQNWMKIFSMYEYTSSFQKMNFIQFRLIVILLALFISTTTLIAQDVVIIAADGTGTSSSGDEFSFALLRDYAQGEIIYFTEDEYSDSTNQFNSSEGHLTFTLPAGGLLEGEVITITETSAGVYTASCATGTVSGTGSWSLTGGDEIYAYSATNSSSPWNSITNIHCFFWYAGSLYPSDQDPTNDYTNCIVLTPNIGASTTGSLYLNDAVRINTTLTMLEDINSFTRNLSGLNLSCTDLTNQQINNTLSNDMFKLENIKIYATGNRLQVLGLQNESANLELYSILGKKILRSSFQGNGQNNIKLPELETGLYIIQLNTKNGKLNKKVIIQ